MYSNNKGRPYFLGFEHEDVVRYRQDFVEYFLKHEDNYYTVTNDTLPQCIAPKVIPTILFCKLPFACTLSSKCLICFYLDR